MNIFTKYSVLEIAKRNCEAIQDGTPKVFAISVLNRGPGILRTHQPIQVSEDNNCEH